MALEVALTHEDMKFLRRRIEGGGGFQGLLRDLQAAQDGYRLRLSEPLARRVVAYVEKYGDGGYQQRLRRLADEIRPQLPALPQQEALF
jgi:hypothetical protein